MLILYLTYFLFLARHPEYPKPMHPPIELGSFF